MTINPKERPVLLSLDGRGFYVLRYTALPEDQFSRVTFELVDPNTGEGGSAEALVDPRLVQALNEYISQSVSGRAFLIWINTSRNEVSWQLRKKVDPII
ncbi:MAG TPA: hypothetical protein VFE98_03485 [Candidatus Bathyarchaeia archaeon]|nr:hypothetical protein [Candidatus Bathyarchaeia archaeon]